MGMQIAYSLGLLIGGWTLESARWDLNLPQRTAEVLTSDHRSDQNLLLPIFLNMGMNENEFVIDLQWKLQESNELLLMLISLT